MSVVERAGGPPPAPTAGHAPAPRPPRRRPASRWLVPLAPAVVLLGVFFAGPVVWSVLLSFTDASLTGSAARGTSFVGLDNVVTLVQDPAVWNAVVITVVFVVGSAVIGQNGLGLALALMLRGRGTAVRSLVTLPVMAAYVVPEIVAAFVWYAFLNPEGTLNTALGGLGLPGQSWLFTVPVLAVVLANIWRGTAFSMLIYLAALSQVPADVDEQAQVDGASGWTRLRYVTIPMIRRAIGTNLVLVTLQTLQVFTLIFVMTAGGPGDKSETLPLLMYEQAFQYAALGYGTAIALVLLAIGAVFSLGYIRAIGKEEI
ncbi:carbohydrate ABC transporter membrane protein 1 (CUT1 family) [Pseudokineococcus lusitanus]|uniref:Carbohydrate ABC transporter membrane protein 1 (CUT1 family) n=1 Tax=Pseudokineococcus lusitanus TaxID=763993 RepID=A0A3N1GWP4_9ACTN|nr:carbohydrate ABC transporter membrane protein 1 (CUT1 family) [Pseudokineococcus lusitanus]